MDSSSLTKNEFYEKFWVESSYSGTEPNAEETLRYAVIESYIKSIVARANVGRDLRILDVGCGRGWMTARLGEYGQVLGLDPVPGAIALAKKLFPGIRFISAEVRDLAAKGAGTFDLITCSEVLEHIPYVQQGEFLRTIHGLLKPQGQLILTTPRAEMWRAYAKKGVSLQPVEDWLSSRELRRMLQGSGFTQVHATNVWVGGGPFAWPGRLAALLASNNLPNGMGLHRLTKTLKRSEKLCRAVLARAG